MNNGPEDAKFAEGSGADGLALEAQDPVLERALKQALRHEDPPAGFADRLMARAVPGDRPAALPAPPAPPHAKAGRLLTWPMRKVWMRGGIAAALILGALEGESTYKHIREQQRRIAEATAQFQTTERVTVHALAQAREQLQRAGVPLTLD